MPKSNFFVRNSSSKKASLKRKNVNDKKILNKRKKKDKVEEIISSEDDLSDKEIALPDDISDEETEQEKKLRLTKKYLAQIEIEEEEKHLEDDTKEAIARRLKEEALEEAGRLQKKKAHEFENKTPQCHEFKGQPNNVTCIAFSSSEKFFFSGYRDGVIIKWDLEKKTKAKTIHRVKKGTENRNKGHTDDVLALALSSDDKFLASGSRCKIINIWNPETMEHLKTFKGHKDAISSLVFLRGSHQLLSASCDASLKLWDLDEMGYVETLFGHSAPITDIDNFLGEVALTTGGRDNTVRLWKIAEESQLVFQANNASLDCVCASSHQSFVTGSDDGSLLLWGTQKKKPMSKLLLSHGIDPESEEPNWIVSLCSLPNTDLIASGSKDGFIRLWRRDDDSHSLKPVSTIPVCGFVNCLQFSPSGKYLIAGVGKQHRLGNWWKLKEANNRIYLYCFSDCEKGNEKT